MVSTCYSKSHFNSLLSMVGGVLLTLVVVAITCRLVFSDNGKASGLTEQAADSSSDARTVDNIPRSITNRFGMEFVEIPAGRFYMGRLLRGKSEISKVEWLETQLHIVEITEPFFLGVTEITGWEMSEISIAKGKYRAELRTRRPDSEPSFSIASWNAANNLAKSVSELDSEYNYRLPTEAEWEYACRGQIDGGYPKEADKWVVQPRGAFGIMDDVKSAAPNAFSLYGMLLNDGEYCSDWYSVDYYNRSPLKDPTGPNCGKSKIVRGFKSHHGTIVWRRDRVPPNGDDKLTIGVRLVLEPKKRNTSTEGKKSRQQEETPGTD